MMSSLIRAHRFACSSQLRRRGPADKKRPPSSVSLDAFGLKEDLFCDGGGLNESRTKDVELEINDANFSDAASFCRSY